MRKKIVAFGLILALSSPLYGFMPVEDASLKNTIGNYLTRYCTEKKHSSDLISIEKLQIDNSKEAVIISISNNFANQDLTSRDVKKLFKGIKKVLPSYCRKYQLSVQTCGTPLQYLPEDAIVPDNEGNRFWGDIEYKDAPWTENASRPFGITHGLYNRHITLWASHGRYYDADKGVWKWQRPNLFGTTEDLFTQTIVVPYLIPMLQNAGAVVFTPRERDWQTDEQIVDNDVSKSPSYLEVNVKGDWKTTPEKGFSFHLGTYENAENPFTAGTARMAKATKSKNYSLISYQPYLNNDGKYAVYVSYQTLDKSVPDAEYIVYHKGEATRFTVNQTMGGSTWVYLGTFDFAKGSSQENRVVITNRSKHHGVVTADAVRFGGGMGNIERGGTTSGYPRCLEGARYYTQWAGAPATVYNGRLGQNDYADDINARSYMSNWLGGGSCYEPSIEGKKVPVELSLAVHSDAGFDSNGGLIGSLAICTTNFNEGKLNSGISRLISKDFANRLLNGFDRDLPAIANRWARRYLWDRNYSETRNPEVPSAIIETLSHQNFPDMILGQDPNFKFAMARSLYKTVTRFINEGHGRPTIIQPLAPHNFKVEFTDNSHIRLAWKATEDNLEPSAYPNAYVVYTAIGASGYDNGTIVKKPFYDLQIVPGIQYNFKVTAINRGGESFPTEELSAYRQEGATKNILVVNGFNRLSGPAVIDNGEQQGFELDKDPGVSYGLTAGWNGKQQEFSVSRIGIEGPGGLGYSGDELAGHFIMGNDFSAVKAHTEAIASARKYNVVSCSAQVLETESINLSAYQAIDLILGLQKYNSHALGYYKVLPKTLQNHLRSYTQKHGNLIVSGSYIGSDMQDINEQQFLTDVLKVSYQQNDSTTAGEFINGLGASFDIYRQTNPQHYAATSVDILNPVAGAICAMQYSDGTSAAVGYQGNDYHVFTTGFPLECIKSRETRNAIMRGILQYVMK